MVIIFEGIGQEYIGIYNDIIFYMFFIDFLLIRSWYFWYVMVNGKKFIEGIFVVMGGIFMLMDNLFIFFFFVGNVINILLFVLKKYGYLVVFYYGVINGFMCFNSYVLQVGYDWYFG